MVVWGIKQGTLAHECGAHKSPAMETAFGGNEKIKQRKFLLERENKT